jgi:hypothetical protein
MIFKENKYQKYNRIEDYYQNNKNKSFNGYVLL